MNASDTFKPFLFFFLVKSQLAVQKSESVAWENANNTNTSKAKVMSL
jgi:hypothetical protein